MAPGPRQYSYNTGSPICGCLLIVAVIICQFIPTPVAAQTSDSEFDFGFERPTLPEPKDFKNRNLLCDNYCSQSKIRTPITVVGWPVSAEDSKKNHRLDITSHGLGFASGIFVSLPFNSKFKDTGTSEKLKNLDDKGSLSSVNKVREHATYYSGKRYNFIEIEGPRSTSSMWFRLMRDEANGWQPEAFNVCLIAVCPADEIRSRRK